ncbi:transporter [Spirochaeta thermophila DSM 6192]|uniref:Transporter n=1 Tax=Winmispira thermophila (strain ATCC 49972 / DSM 6192 / RI 19.B1) TaxID=665571 RepID=E0RUB1_WINT6|nr:transporter [Spirochaeta thermophila DSM 6192]
MSHKERHPLRLWEYRWGLAFIAPWLLGFLIFYLFPMVASFVFSLLDFSLADPGATTFVGFVNWRRAFVEDPEVLASVGRILLFALISLPIGMLFALAVALLLHSRYLLGTRAFRTLFYLPSIVPFVAAVIIWQGVLNEHTGWINLAIEGITGLDVTGTDGIRWLADPRLIYFTYTLIGLWGLGNTIIIFLAGLQGIPIELYEAAQIDGAGPAQRFFSVTLPLITPVVFYNVVIGVIGLMQYFLPPYVINMGSGFPNGMTNFPMIYFYRQAFTYLNMGYGAVIAWIIFFLGLFFTLILFRTSRYWVFYAGGGEES